jgi:arsenate reductase (thioredoxin)
MRFALIRTASVSVCALALTCSSAQQSARQNTRILFICEHGNVKSLMAASYFNKLAQQRGLPYRAIARGTDPNSTTVPPAIINGLGAEGVDVRSFHPLKLRNSDIARSARVITIGVELPRNARNQAQTRLEQWYDVPPASMDYLGAQRSLKEHVAMLIDELASQ